MSIAAHAASVDVTAAEIVITHSTLATSLGAPAREAIPLGSIFSVEAVEPTAASFGALLLHAGETTHRVRFAPGSSPAAAAALVDAALRGDVPAGAVSAASVPGLNFTALDVETANDYWGSVCQVGVVRFRDGQPVEERAWLCRPPAGLEHFEDVNISIHGITPADVADAPAFGDVLPQVVDFVGADVMVAHNAIFDSTALRQAALAAQVPAPAFPVACSLALARDASKAGRIDVANHKLPTVAAAVGAGAFKHHDAAEDARAAGHIVAGLARAFGFEGSIDDLYGSRDFVLGAVSPAEVMPVLRTATAPTSPADLGAGTDFRDPVGSPAAAGATARSADAASSSTNSGQQSSPRARGGKGGQGGQRRPAPWDSVATPDTIPVPNPDADPNGALFGQHVTLTGDFEPFDKGTLWNAIAARGGQVGKSVTKKTTVLALGTWATKTSKEKRAEELIAKGQDIQMWPQERLIDELGLNDAPPF